MTSFAVSVLLWLLCAAANSVFAGNVDNQNNYSAEWVRSLNRNAATDSSDAVVYNPAGTVMMENGLYVSVSGQYAYKDYWHKKNGVTYESDTPSYVPGIFGLYKTDRWATFAAYTITCGGGKVEYGSGTATTQAIAFGVITASGGLYHVITKQHMEADSFYHAITLGGAFALNNKISVSLAIRYIDAQIKRKGYTTVSGTAPDTTLSLDYEETDQGYGAILGLNLAPAKELNIGFRYETKTNLNLKAQINRDDLGLLTDDSNRKRDLPALFGVGIKYHISPRVKVEADLTYYLNSNADWDDVPLSIPADESEKENGYDLGMALEYSFNTALKASMGYMFTDTGLNPDNMCIEAPELNAHTLAGGGAYEIFTDWDINLGMAKVFFLDETTSSGIKLNKRIYLFALGVQHKF